jgi:hypothetical protein
LLSQKVAIEPKKSWQILYNLPAEARSAEATNAEYTIWLSQRDKARTDEGKKRRMVRAIYNHFKRSDLGAVSPSLALN